MYELVKVTADQDWTAYDEIRRQELFLAKGRMKYTPKHEDEFLPDNHPLLIKHSGMPLGTTRLDDRKDGSVIVRLVAITAAEQGKGHGRILAQMTYDYAAKLGANILYVNAAPDALDYYRKLGWEDFLWDASELTGSGADCTQMRKILKPAEPQLV